MKLKPRPLIIHNVIHTDIHGNQFTKFVGDCCLEQYLKLLPAKYGYVIKVFNQYAKCSHCGRYTKEGQEWHNKTKPKRKP